MKYKAKGDINVMYQYSSNKLEKNTISGLWPWIKKDQIIDASEVVIDGINYLKKGNEYYNINSFSRQNFFKTYKKPIIISSSLLVLGTILVILKVKKVF